MHPYVGQWWPPGHIIGYEHTFVHAIADFVNAVAKGKSVQPTFEDGLKNQQVLEAVEQSAQKRKWVKVKYDLDWIPQSLPSNNPEELKSFLLEESQRWDEERIERRGQRMLDDSEGDLDAWLRTNWQFALNDSEKCD